MSLASKIEPAEPGCELCGATASRELYTARDHLRISDQTFIVAACARCGTMRTLPPMHNRELADFYPQDYWGGEPTEKWIRQSQSEKLSFLKSCALSDGRILDVGCGAGFFLRALDPAIWDRHGVEIGKRASEAANNSLGTGRVSTGTLIESAFTDSAFDVVTFWSALEHTNEPRANLIEARRILRKSGTVIVQVPNGASYQARFFGGDWFALDVPRHRYHFTEQSLARLLSETGFEIYRRTFFSKTHNAHALRQSLKGKLYGEDPSLRGRALFMFSIPLIKPVDWLMTVLGQGATITVAARAV